jgi:tetratricopeptide (TPR) repeat protein
MPHKRTTPKTFRRAKELRRALTPAERKLWARLHNHQLEGYGFRHAIDRDPNLAQAYSNLGLLLCLQHREREAIPLLENHAKLAPQDFNPLLALASIHKLLGDATTSAQYAGEARALIPADDWYNLACLESVCGNMDAALEHLRRATQQPRFDRDWARRDPDFAWIRGDPRFAEIVGAHEPLPESSSFTPHPSSF